MPTANHATMVAANATAHKIDALVAINPPPAWFKGFSLPGVAHDYKIAFGRSVL
jgi:hypothetical protein